MPLSHRPAETAGAAAAVAFLIARLVGVKDAATVTALGTVVGLIPAGVTWLVELVRRKPSAAPGSSTQP